MIKIIKINGTTIYVKRINKKNYPYLKVRERNMVILKKLMMKNV